MSLVLFAWFDPLDEEWVVSKRGKFSPIATAIWQRKCSIPVIFGDVAPEIREGFSIQIESGEQADPIWYPMPSPEEVAKNSGRLGRQAKTPQDLLKQMKQVPHRTESIDKFYLTALQGLMKITHEMPDCDWCVVISSGTHDMRRGLLQALADILDDLRGKASRVPTVELVKVVGPQTVKSVDMVEGMSRAIFRKSLAEWSGTVDVERQRFKQIFRSEDKKMITQLDRAYDATQSDDPVLILGETGTGKSFLAKEIHRYSSRKSKTLVCVDCGAIPSNLIESDLFGHVKGAYTGATRDRKGLIRDSDGGTIFLDEIGELSIELQVKLLQVVQDGKVRPMGSDKTHDVDVRIFAATNRDLRDGIQKGWFRADLFHRLNVHLIDLPPLRRRDRSDLRTLILHLLAERNRERYPTLFHYHKEFSEEAMNFLVEYPWPGNIRQMENVIRNIVGIPDASLIGEATVRRLLPVIVDEPSPGPSPRSLSEVAEEILERISPNTTLPQILRDLKREIVHAASEGKTQKSVAAQLGLSEAAISSLIKGNPD